MSPFFDELEGQLRAAAQAEAGATARAPHARRRRPRAGRRRPRAGRRRPAWWPARIHAGPVLASVVVVAVVVAALALLGHGRPHASPPASPPPNAGLAALIEKTPQKQLRREFAYIGAATKTVLASPQCQTQTITTAAFVHGTPDPTLLSILGVLRRPATPADRPNPSVFVGVPEVYAGSARRAFFAEGDTYYVAVAPTDSAATTPSKRCFALQKRALARYLPKIPSALREPTKALQAGYIAWFLRLATSGPRDSACLVDSGRGGSGGGCGITAAQIENGVSPSDDNGVFTGLVPDGVASVTLAFAAARGRSARSVTGQVRANVYAIPVSGADQPGPEPAVIWRSAQGRVLKTVAVPTKAQAQAACRQELVACTVIQDSGVTTTTSSSTRPAVRGQRVAP